MALADQIEADFVDLVLNTDEHAETVTHRPRDNSADDSAITALVTLQDQAESQDRGRQFEITGTVDVEAGTLTLDETDRWYVRGRWFSVVAINLQVAGKDRVHIKSVDGLAAGGAGRPARSRG